MNLTPKYSKDVPACQNMNIPDQGIQNLEPERTQACFFAPVTLTLTQ